MKNQTPYRPDEEIWQAAEEFRARPDVAPYSGPPVDILSICELVLGLNPIPFDNMSFKYGYEAALSPTLEDILIDSKGYLQLEAGRPPWVERRLRFSLAHELGHFILHANEIRRLKFKSFDDFKRWAATPSAYKRPEYQAHEFAGRLLVPVDALTRLYDELCAPADQKSSQWRDIPGARTKLAKRIADRFMVNSDVIEYRLDRERIWPAE